jgi:hypothetical protein
MRSIAILTASLLVLAACDRTPDEPDRPTTPPTTTAPEAAPAPPAETQAGAPDETALAPPTEAQAEAALAFMNGVMQPTAEELWGSVGFIIDASGEHDLSPKSDEEWQAVVGRADAVIDLAEGLKNAAFAWDPDTWSAYCDEVIAAAEANRRAAEAQSVDAMYEAGELLDRACESCHLHFEEGESAASHT